jgi:ABC-2 type transport system ATP-binding protein
MIQAVDLSKTYEDGLLALDNLNLAVQPGQLYCLLGANGAGKTTTINLFLNFIEPTSGSAFINGIDVTKEPIRAKKYAAYLSENVMLYGAFTARQNMDFFSQLATGRKLDKDTCYAILDRVGLQKDACEQRVKLFSKGMRQKLGLAITLVKDAPAILLDEPTSGLDPKSAAELMKLLRGLCQDGKAIFMSTHDVFRAREHADIIGIMKEGQLISVLTKEELAKQDLEKVYLDYMR